MQDSTPQADGNAEARSRGEWRSDRSADTVLRDGGADTDSGGRRRGSERVGRGGVGEKPFEGFAPTGPAPTPKDAPPDQTNECAEPGVTPSRYRNRAKLSAPPRQSSPRERLPRALEPKGFPAKRTADRPWDTPGMPPSSPAYGGWMVKTSISPRSRRGRASRRSPARKWALRRPRRRALSLPSAAASAEISTPQTSEARTSWATASATGPAPVATSTATRCPRRRRSALIASSASNSLDARGTKTPSLTSRSSPRNA